MQFVYYFMNNKRAGITRWLELYPAFPYTRIFT